MLHIKSQHLTWGGPYTKDYDAITVSTITIAYFEVEMALLREFFQP